MRLMTSNWVFWLLALPAVLFLLVLTVFGTRILINPSYLDITPCGDVVLFRDYPMVNAFGIDYPIVRYIATVTPLTPETNNGYVCREDNGRGNRYNHDHQRGFGKWHIAHYAEACMADPVGFKFNVQYTAYLFDAIPLRPITVEGVFITRDSLWELCPFHSNT